MQTEQNQTSTVAAVSVELSQFDRALAQVEQWAAEHYSGPVNDSQSLLKAKKARLFWVTKRTETEKQKKEIKRQIKAVADAVELRAGKYTDALLVHELAVKEKITAYEEAKEKEKAEKAKEAERVLELIKGQINEFKAAMIEKLNAQTTPEGIDTTIAGIEPGTPANFALLSGEYAMALLAIKEAGTAQKMRLQIAALEAEKIARENEEKERKEAEEKYGALVALCFRLLNEAGSVEQLKDALEHVEGQTVAPAFAERWANDKKAIKLFCDQRFFQIQAERREAEMAVKVERMAKEKEAMEKEAMEKERAAMRERTQYREGQLINAGFQYRENLGGWANGDAFIPAGNLLSAAGEEWGEIFTKSSAMALQYEQRQQSIIKRTEQRIAALEGLGYKLDGDGFYKYYKARKVGQPTIQNAEDPQWEEIFSILRNEVNDYNKSAGQSAKDAGKIREQLKAFEMPIFSGIETDWGIKKMGKIADAFNRFKVWAENQLSDEN